MARSVALLCLSVLLGAFFVLLGTLKLTPIVSEDMHKEMKANFKRHRTVFPLSEITGFKPKTSTYRKTVGIVEVVSGLLLIFGPGMLREVANVVLLVLVSGAMYSHWALQDPWHQMSSAIVFGLLLTCRMAIFMQVFEPEVVSTEKKTE